MPSVSRLVEFVRQVASRARSWTIPIECGFELFSVELHCISDRCSSEIFRARYWASSAIPPWQMKVYDIQSRVIRTIAAEVSVQVRDELEARSELASWSHADSVHVLTQSSDKSPDIEWLANRRCHPNMGKTQFLKLIVLDAEEVSDVTNTSSRKRTLYIHC